MQNHPNIKLIKAFFEAYSNKDIDRIKMILSPEIKWHVPGNHKLSGVKKGIDEIIVFFEKLNDYAFDAKPIVMGVNHDFVIDCHKNWTNLDKGENLNIMSCLLWKISEGKIVEVFNFPEDQNKVDNFFNTNIHE